MRYGCTLKLIYNDLNMEIGDNTFRTITYSLLTNLYSVKLMLNLKKNPNIFAHFNASHQHVMVLN